MGDGKLSFGNEIVGVVEDDAHALPLQSSGEIDLEGIAQVGAARDHPDKARALERRPQQPARVFDFRKLGHDYTPNCFRW